MKSTPEEHSLPPVKYFIGLSFILALMLLYLDGNARFQSLLTYLPFPVFINNLLNMLLFLLISSLLIGGALWFILWLFFSIINKDNHVPEANSRFNAPTIANFLFFFLFVYISLIYLKLFIISLSTKAPDIMKISVIVVSLLFVVSIVLYFLYFRKKIDYQSLQKAASSSFKAFKIAFVVLLVIAAVLYLTNLRPEAANEKKAIDSGRPNIIIISFDSLSAKYMSLYGYERQTTPNIDKFSKECYTFKRMVANSNFTWCSLPCILGRYPRGYYYPSYTPRDAPPVETLVTELKKYGYDKRYFVSYARFNKPFREGITDYVKIRNLDSNAIFQFLYRGQNRKNFQWISEFLAESERFLNIFCLDHPSEQNIEKPLYPLPLYLDYIVEQLKKYPPPVFMWTHLYQPHTPYNVPEPFQHHFGTSKKDEYDGAVLYVDSLFGEFIEQLKKNGLYDKSIIILCSDHGEVHGEQEPPGFPRFARGVNFLCESVNNIPLLIHLPGQRSGRAPQTCVEILDIPPTVLELINAPVPDWMEGESMVKYMENEKLLSDKIKLCIPTSYFQEKVDFSNKSEELMLTFGDMYNAYWKNHKIGWYQIYGEKGSLMQFKFYCLYDLVDDPEQEKNLITEPDSGKLLDKVYNNERVMYYR